MGVSTGLSLKEQQSAADGDQHGGQGGAEPVRSSLQGLLVGLVRAGGALGRRHAGGRQGGAAGAHVVEVPGELRLPGLLPQRLPDGRRLAGAALQS